MTQFNPNLSVDALMVTKGGKTVFLEKFHRGLNIIRGQNSSGKSTIMDFLFYGLGGDLLANQWRETAVTCDTVMVQASLNGKQLTLMRDVEAASRRPMKLFYGTLDEAREAAVSGWEIYNFSRSSKESFSQVIFRFLGFPEVEYGEANAKITLNQILRLLYSDQMSSVEKIFRSQSFDLGLIRQTVGDLLCGAYSDKYLQARLRRKEAIEEFKAVKSNIALLVSTHARDGEPFTADWLNAEESNLLRRIDDLSSEIEELEALIFDAEFDDRLTLNDQEVARNRVVDLQTSIARLEEKIGTVELVVSDNERYMRSLATKLAQLNQSEVVVRELGHLSFDFCPSCLAPIDNNLTASACALCKSPHDAEATQKRVLKLINEYARQSERAGEINRQKQAELIALKSRLSAKKEAWEQATRHYTISLRSPTSEMRSKLRNLNRDAGYAYRELEELATKKAIIVEIAELTAQKDQLQEELNQLDIIIRSGEASQIDRLSRSKEKLEREILDFLRRDLSRQSTFDKAREVTIDFDGDRLAVNGESYFSASSMVYLRNSFFASFLFAAANDPNFLHPRFLIMDTIEDKGLEPERSQNFQRLLKEKSDSAKSEHQIIIATSMIAPELNIPEVTVGEEYSHLNRTLKYVAD